ncbi:hypothetical protein [Saccharothrix sp. HUAS TT1]|uniref:hypothetical protein n=1 Tax=unclassified Saccharothrix TaxID=2593673 RepID=UPI00345C0000
MPDPRSAWRTACRAPHDAAGRAAGVAADLIADTPAEYGAKGVELLVEASSTGCATSIPPSTAHGS